MLANTCQESLLYLVCINVYFTRPDPKGLLSDFVTFSAIAAANKGRKQYKWKQAWKCGRYVQQVRCPSFSTKFTSAYVPRVASITIIDDKTPPSSLTLSYDI